MSQLDYGFQILIVGMGVVFIALFGLSLLMRLFKRLFYDNQEQPSQRVEQQEEATVEEDARQDHATVAAISAAIAAFMGKPAETFNIVTIKRTKPSPWATAGRQELLDTDSMRKL